MSRGAERAAREAELRARLLRLRQTDPELSQPELAQRLGVSAPTVYRWLREARQAGYPPNVLRERPA